MPNSSDKIVTNFIDNVHLAACREEDPDLFFPIGTVGPAVVQIEMAKAVCNRCPIREGCLEYAIATGQNDGVWGGKSEDERRVIRRARRRAELGMAPPIRPLAPER